MILNGHIGPARLITAEVSAWRSTAHCHYMVQVGMGRWSEVFRLGGQGDQRNDYDFVSVCWGVGYVGKRVGLTTA